MIKLYFKLFSISYDSLATYYFDIKDSKTWNKKRKNQNKKINKLVFEYISKQKKYNLSDQFILDMINYFFYLSFRLRKNKILINKFYIVPKHIFVSIALTNNFINSIKLLSIRLYHLFFTEIVFPEINNKKKGALIIGFPEFSFSRNNLRNDYKSSFIEYLFDKKFIDKKTELISFNEYKLKKLQVKPLLKNISFAKRCNRAILKRIFALKLSFKIFKKVIFNSLKILNEFHLMPFSFYSYYTSRILIARELKYIFSILENKKIKFKIFFISTYDIGNIKYDNKYKYYHFNYSRNNIYPSSKKTIYNEINKTFNLKVDDILEDVELDNFTLVYPNSLGFSYHSFFYSRIRSEINKTFKINLLNKLEATSKQESYSNLGYAFIEKVNLIKDKINIIIYDIPAESEENNISRKGVHGMYSVLNAFVEVYLKELLDIFNHNRFEIYYKGKYSYTKAPVTLFEQITSKRNVKINVINQYSKIDFVNELKFDFAVSQPFTSTYYNLGAISKHSLYYIPNKFLDFIPCGIKGACYGSNDLKIKIRKYEKNRR